MEHYTFDKYIAVEKNTFAKEACIRVAENIDSRYSPLIICGENGTGKTHLVKAIETYIKEKHSDKRVEYVDADTFTEEIIASMRNPLSRTPENVRMKYRTADIFIFDGLEKIQKRDTTKEELLDIIHHLQEDNKTIVLTSALGIEQLFNDHHGLKSIVEASYLVRIEKQETVLIDHYVDQGLLKGLTLSDETIWFIKRNCEGISSKAKGMINTIKMWIDINEREPSLEELRFMFNISDEPSFVVLNHLRS